MTISPSHKYKNQAKLNAITDLTVQHIDRFYDYFNTEIEYKNDKSPLTLADMRCNDHILKYLDKLENQ